MIRVGCDAMRRQVCGWVVSELAAREGRHRLGRKRERERALVEEASRLVIGLVGGAGQVRSARVRGGGGGQAGFKKQRMGQARGCGGARCGNMKRKSLRLTDRKGRGCVGKWGTYCGYVQQRRQLARRRDGIMRAFSGLEFVRFSNAPMLQARAQYDA